MLRFEVLECRKRAAEVQEVVEEEVCVRSGEETMTEEREVAVVVLRSGEV